MRATLGGLVLFLVLAGCTSATPESSVDAGSDDGAPAFTAPLKVADSRNMQEETFIAVSPDAKTILTCLHGEFKEPSIMFASTDGGETFRELKADPSPMSGGDCDVAIGPDGTWYFLHSTVAGCTVVATSDEGRTWTMTPAAAIPTNGMADRPWIEPIGDDVFLSYMPLWPQPGTIAVTKSTDKGRTWTTPTHVTTIQPPDRTNAIQGQFLESPDGQTIRLPIKRFPPPWTEDPQGLLSMTPVPATLEIATTSDRGAMWDLETVAGPIADSLVWTASAAQADDGTLYFAQYLARGENVDYLMLTSLDGGTTWSEPRTVALDVKLAEMGMPWIDGRTDGTATYFFQANGAQFGAPNDDIWTIAARLDARNEALVDWMVPLAQGSGEFVAVDHDASGAAHFTFLNDGQLWYVREQPPTT